MLKRRWNNYHSRQLDREEYRIKRDDQFWASLKDLQTSGAVPRNMVVGFTVDDPRLRYSP